MRFYSESKWTRIHRQKEWHDWFAWHPVRIHNEIVWLEIVERRRTDADKPWWYKVKK